MCNDYKIICVSTKCIIADQAIILHIYIYIYIYIYFVSCHHIICKCMYIVHIKLYVYELQ